MNEDKAMSEQKMSRDEMVVGSYVCPVEGDGPRGVVTRVELDPRGPEYDLLHVSDADGATRCQRAVMRLVDSLATTADDDVAALRLYVGLLKIELKSAVDARDMATSLMAKRQRDYDGMHAALLRAEKGHADVQEDLEKVRDDYAALRSMFDEAVEAHRKTHEHLDREIANHEAADKYGRKAGDERDALRAEVAKLEAKNAEHEEARRSLRQEVQDFLRGMNEETERANKIAEELEGLRVDHAALYETYAEFKAAYQKAHDECASLSSHSNHMSRVADERWHELEEARKAGDALRAQLIAQEASEAAKLKGLRQVAHDRAYEIERQKHEIAHVESREREALAEAAAQRERADVWQAAAQDALDQMAHWRKQAKEGTKLCETTVGIDFRSTGTIQRKLAEVAAEAAEAVAARASQRDDVRRG